MPIDSTKKSLQDSVDSDHIEKRSYPASINSRWELAIAAGGPAFADTAGADITDPTNQRVAGTANHFILEKSDLGGLVRARFLYAKAITLPLDPIIQLFGRTKKKESGGGFQSWELLPNVANDHSAVLATQTDDVIDDTDTFKQTTPDNRDNAWDISGCDEVIVGIKRAATSAGDLTTSTIELKNLN